MPGTSHARMQLTTTRTSTEVILTGALSDFMLKQMRVWHALLVCTIEYLARNLLSFSPYYTRYKLN